MNVDSFQCTDAEAQRISTADVLRKANCMKTPPSAILPGENRASETPLTAALLKASNAPPGAEASVAAVQLDPVNWNKLQIGLDRPFKWIYTPVGFAEANRSVYPSNHFSIEIVKNVAP
jgi:hypothetical protein